MKVKKAGVISHPRVEGGFIASVAEKMEANGVELAFDPVSAEKLGKEKTPVEDMRVDLAVVFGGDGTLLWVAGKIPDEPLLLGINIGRVGHLAELTPEDALEKMELLFSGDFSVDDRAKLCAGAGLEALNEILVVSKEPATLLEFRLCVDGINIAHFRADGIMFSTPTGSTGYSLSAGGPILHPKLDGYLATPINPVVRSQTPLVVPGSAKAEVELLREDRGAKLILDGQQAKELAPKGKVEVRRCKTSARFVRFSEDYAYDHMDLRKLR